MERRQTDRTGDGRREGGKEKKRRLQLVRPFPLPCLVNTHYEVGGRADNSHALSLSLLFPHFSEKGKREKAENVFSLSFVS